MAYSFTTSGALPKLTSPFTLPIGGGSTPASKALSSAQPYSSLQPVNKSYSILQPASTSYSAPAMATSVTTKKPVAGSVTKAAPPIASSASSPIKPVAQTVQSSPSIQPLAKPPVQPIATATVPPPAYDNMTGLLTAYGRSQGLPEVNAPKNSQTQTQPTTTGYQTSSPPTYAGLVGALANNATQPNPIYTQASQGLLNASSRNPLEAGEAYDVYSGAVQRENKLKSAIAGKYGDIESDSIPLEFQQGREQALSRQYASQLEAASQATTQAQQALGYGIQEQQAQQAGFGAAQSGATAQQGLQQSGLSAAAGYAAPSGSYPFVFDPLTGGFKSASGSAGILSPQQAAQDVISGKTSYEQAKAALSYMGGTGEAQLQSAITQAGGNPLQLQAQGAATQSNLQAQGTAGTDIARQGLADATNSYMKMSGQAQNATQQAQRVEQILSATGLNSASSTDYNKAINQLSGRFSNPDFTALQSALLEARSFYGALLAMRGGTPTGNESQALNSLDITKSAQAISASIRELDAAVGTMLQSQAGIRDSYQQQLNGGGQNTGASSGSPSGAITWDNVAD